MNKLFFILFFILFLIPVSYAADQAIIYKNSACGHCNIYLEELNDFLTRNNIENVVEKNILDDKKALIELDKFTQEKNIPYELQGHMVVVINNLIIEGHVPIKVLEEIFEKYPDKNFPNLVLFQDSMDENVKTYTVLDENGDIKECNIDNLENCKNIKTNNKITGNVVKDGLIQKSLPFLVLFNGLFAGIHPCTISVLLFFISFLFTIRRSRAGIFKVGLSYIIGIFIAYFGIGIGIFKVVSFSNSPHFAAKIGALLVLLLGLFNIITFFTKKKNVSLGIPSSSKQYIVDLIQRASVPAAFIVGLFVGICSFGCTAGIYLSIMSMLFVKANYLQGLFYLFLYNLMFILPLIIILILAANKKIVERIEKLELAKKDYIKLVAGFLMIILAIVIYLISI